MQHTQRHMCIQEAEFGKCSLLFSVAKRLIISEVIIFVSSKFVSNGGLWCSSLSVKQKLYMPNLKQSTLFVKLYASESHEKRKLNLEENNMRRRMSFTNKVLKHEIHWIMNVEMLLP